MKGIDFLKLLISSPILPNIKGKVSKFSFSHLQDWGPIIPRFPSPNCKLWSNSYLFHNIPHFLLNLLSPFSYFKLMWILHTTHFPRSTSHFLASSTLKFSSSSCFPVNPEKLIYKLQIFFSIILLFLIHSIFTW